MQKSLKVRSLLAEKLLEVLPHVLQQVRLDMSAIGDLTIPQRRVLLDISRRVGSVSAIAEFHGVSQPAMSKMVDALVLRGLVLKSLDRGDRRKTVLKLSAKGESLLRKARDQSQSVLGERFKDLRDEEAQFLLKALEKIDKIFEGAPL